MHFILLGLALIIGLIGLYRFFLNADTKQITALFMVAIFLVVGVALFYMTITGRLPAALALVMALWPLALSWYRRKKHDKDSPAASAPHNMAMSRAEALEVLGLSGTPDETTIRSAHKRLMKKVHPDQEGSAWLAQKLNQARDILLDMRH